MIQELDRLQHINNIQDKTNFDAHICATRLSILVKKMTEYYGLDVKDAVENALGSELLPVVYIKGNSYMYTESNEGLNWYTWNEKNQIVPIDYNPLTEK